MLAKIVYGEARGIASQTEQACIVWTILNRCDAWNISIYSIITTPNQFHYVLSAATVDDYGRNLIDLVKDVLNRWIREKNGETNVGRVLPSNYLYYGGAKGHNWFRTTYKVTGNYWNYSLPSPYSN